MKGFFYATALALLCVMQAAAHPMPNSVLLIDIKPDRVDAELQWPLKELQLAFPNEQLDTNVQTLLQRKGPWLDRYLQRHLQLSDAHDRLWTWSILSKQVTNSSQEATGVFHELVFNLRMQPPAGSSPRHFTLRYDAIMHQVVTHKLLAYIRQDWDGGLSAKDSMDADLGVLMMNLAENRAPTLVVNLDEGSHWKGFKNMVSLGMEHIAEGTDHLLFLLVLLLPAPLLVAGRRWGRSGGTRYSIVRLLKIVTAFTIGHSLTLVAGALGWVHIPAQPVEVLIALSIFIGALHALRPLFPGREVFIAAGFGLVHGMAFAATLANLNLDAGRMTLSILGFNIGIELMQLFVILMTVPWLIILSRYPLYRFVRIGGGLLSAVAALAWMAERILQRPNAVSRNVELLARHGNFVVLVVAVLAVGCYFLIKAPEPVARS